MSDLTDDQWAKLSHAYGPADDIPALLAQLAAQPDVPSSAQPWTALWSALAHQGDVYTASFAAVPVITRIAAENLNTIGSAYLYFISWVEICRQNKSVMIPEELTENYWAAIRSIPELLFGMRGRQWDYDSTRAALMGLAVANGHASIADAISELSSDLLPSFFEWVGTR